MKDPRPPSNVRNPLYFYFSHSLEMADTDSEHKEFELDCMQTDERTS